MVQKKKYYEPAKWVWVAYYVIAVYNLLSGGLDVAAGAGVFGGDQNIFSIVFGGISAVVGLGLLFRLEFIRAIVNFVAAIQILSGARSVIFGLMASMFGTLGLIMVILGILNVVFGALMIYVIGETDRGVNI